MYSVFIDGHQGTTGLRIAERLQGREELTLCALPEIERKNLSARVSMALQADITILCLPDAASRELVNALPDKRGVVIDTSTAHRVDSSFVYGFPELGREISDAVAQSNRIAVPGCHASGIIALTYPLRKAGVLSKDMPLAFTSLTGYSGGGKPMIAEYENRDRKPGLHAPHAYALMQEHKHLPEIVKVCGLSGAPVFQPIVCDFYSGMLVSLSLFRQALSKPMDAHELTALYQHHYAGQNLITVLLENAETTMDPLALAGTDGMQIVVTGNTERMVVYARFDNLGKGASGAAIQCMNLRLGLPETAGLKI